MFISRSWVNLKTKLTRPGSTGLFLVPNDFLSDCVLIYSLVCLLKGGRIGISGKEGRRWRLMPRWMRFLCFIWERKMIFLVDVFDWNVCGKWVCRVLVLCVCMCHGYAVSFFFSAFERCSWSCWITWYGFGEKGRGSNLMKSKLTWYCVTYVYGDDSFHVLNQSSYCSIVIEIKKNAEAKWGKQDRESYGALVDPVIVIPTASFWWKNPWSSFCWLNTALHFMTIDSTIHWLLSDYPCSDDKLSSIYLQGNFISLLPI